MYEGNPGEIDFGSSVSARFESSGVDCIYSTFTILLLRRLNGRLLDTKPRLFKRWITLYIYWINRYYQADKYQGN